MINQSKTTFSEIELPRNDSARLGNNPPDLTISIFNNRKGNSVKYFDLVCENIDKDIEFAHNFNKSKTTISHRKNPSKLSINSISGNCRQLAADQLSPDKVNQRESFYTMLVYLDQILFLDEMSSRLKKLERTILLGRIDEFISVAASCLQISSNCGMFTELKPLSRLDYIKNSRKLADAEILYKQFKNEYEHAKFTLNVNLRQIETKSVRNPLTEPK